MVRGGCLCGGIRFEADTVAMMTHCHCGICRKHLGSSFGTFANVRPEHFRYLSGEDLIERYESSPNNFRAFCRVCGSTVPIVVPGDPGVVIAAGLLEDDPGVRPVLHMMVGSKASWVEIRDDLPKFEEFVPGYENAHRPKPRN